MVGVWRDVDGVLVCAVGGVVLGMVIGWVLGVVDVVVVDGVVIEVTANVSALGVASQ